MSALSWLENDIFLTAHTSSNFDADTIPPTTYSIITRSGNAHQAQKLPEVCSPFGLKRSPPTQLFQRLRDYPPNLRDVIFVSSTASEDINLITRSKIPLSKDYPAEQITDAFTSTVIALDNRRAGVPLTEDYSQTSPIGMALDLSSKDAVEAPIPGEELPSSEIPLPGLIALNNDGVLSIWWIVYLEAVRQKAAYPGLANLAEIATQQPQSLTMANTTPTTASAFGQSLNTSSGSAFGSTFGSSTKPAFASPSPLGTSGSVFGASGTPGNTSGAFGASSTLGSTNSAFGAPIGNTVSAFGAASSLGSKPSLWESQGNTQPSIAPAFGAAATNKPTFGSSNVLGTPSSGPSFGNAGGLGNRQSVWGNATATSTPTATFGTPGGSGFFGSAFGGSTPAAAFGSATKVSSPNNSGGFAAFASSGGFLAAAAQSKGENVLSKSNNTVSFDSNMDTSSPFGTATPIGASTPQKTGDSGGLFGLGQGFKIASSFKGDGTAKDDAPKPSSDNTNSLFGLDFGKSIEAVQKEGHVPEIKEADMLSDQSDKSDNPATPDTPEKTPLRTTTPADTPAPVKFFAPPTAPPNTGGLFGTQAQTNTTPAAVQTSAPTTISTNELASDIDTFKAKEGDRVKIERQPSDSQKTDLQKIPEAPLPPDPRSKENYNSAESSESSVADGSNSREADPPLPPDFVFPKNARQTETKTSDKTASPAESSPLRDTPRANSRSPDEEGLPSDRSDSDYDSGDISESEHGIDEEGSGVDVARELTPPPEASQTPETSRASKIQDHPRLFGSPSFPAPQPERSLFAEIGSPPILVPSRLNDQELPRSPSPTRPSKGLETLRIETRPESSRSVSESVLQNRNVEKIKLGLSRTIVPHQIRQTVEEQKAEELRREEQRQAKRAAEEQALEDEDHMRIRQELEAPIEPTLTLAPFLSHQDYVGHIDKKGIPWQIESLYRDMNSMVDLLGLNARSLQAFILGHDREIGEQQPNSDVLDSDREWCLNDVSLLDDLEEEFSTRLQDFSLDELQAKLLKCSELHRDLLTLRKKRLEIQHAVELRKDPTHLEALRTAPLPTDQAIQQHDLRKAFINTQKLLTDAEEQIVLLRAKLAVRSATSGLTMPGFGAQKAPTVEAIQNTIAKMTGMVEKKSGDIDVLEVQMRRLRELELGDNRSSRQGTPVRTPSRKSFYGTPGSHNGFFTPRSSSRLGASVGSLVVGMHGEGQGSTEVVLEETARRYEEKVRDRREINRLVKEALIKGGMRVRAFDDV